MNCPRCRAENREGRRFCGECGLSFAATCPSCGFLNEEVEKFCGGCGRSIAEAPAAAGPRFSAPASYTPKHLAERILSSKAALEGERKQVTVLFCDVVESTRLSGKLDPEAMHELMDRALRLMAEAVHRYEGTVNQFLGDGIMALFGAPVALEDHALRAVQAALAIQETMGGLSAELKRQSGGEVRLRLGLNTGQVVVGKIGDDLRMDYTAVGETTNLAARLQTRAEPGTILVGETTHRLVQGYVQSESLGRVEVRGFTEPVGVYRISGRRRRTRLEVSAERGLSELVGRERELSVLRECFARAAAGRGQVVAVGGEPGVGKSRLLHELRGSLQGERVTFLAGHCAAYRQSTPYWPLLEILRSNFEIDDDDNPLQIDEKVRRGLRALDPAMEPMLPSFRDLLLHRPEQPLKGADTRTQRQKTFEAIRALTVTGGERAPLVLAVEDLHWVDQTSEECLAFLVESLAGLRVLLITTHRPGYAVRWADKTYYTQLALDVLSDTETASMLRGLLGVQALPDGFVSRVHEKAEGNPLFVEEITRSLVERGVLLREGAGVLWASAAPVEFPETAQDIIRARIDRLEEGAKRTAQVAAVIGREFGERLLAEVVETASLLGECLDTLKHAELVYEKRFFPELQYIFRHAIIQDVAYQSMLARRRRDLHAAIGRAIETLYAGRLTEHYEVLAHHFVAGDVRDRAVEYLVKAGDKAATAFAGVEALAFYERALPLLSDTESRERADVLHKAGQLRFFWTADFDTCRRYYEEALALYERLADKPNIVAVRMDVAALYISTAWDGALEDEALPHVEALAALTEADPDSMQKGLIYQRIAHLYLHRSEPATALTWTRRAVDLFVRLGVSMGTALGTALAYTGNVNEGLAYSEGNWELVSKAANPLIASIFGHEISLVLVLLRDPVQACDWAERVLPEAAKTKSPVLQSILQRPLTFGYALAGEVASAERGGEAIRQLESTTLAGCPWEDTAALGFRDLRLGRLAEARSYLARILEVWEVRNQVAAISACSLVLAACDLESGDHALAEQRATRSLEICRRGGNVLFELWALPVLCEIYLKTARRERAAECIERGFALMSPNQNWRGLPAPLHLARAMLAMSDRRWDEAERDFETALAIDRRYVLPFDEAKTLAEWGRMDLVRASAGDRERAGERLGQALAIFERVAAAREVEKVRVTLAQPVG